MAKYYVFIGNPGSGKSTTANTAIERIFFKSGLSTNGACVTETHQETKVDLPGLKGFVMDTPGLADVKSRAVRAAEIEAALKKDADYAVFFVNRLVDGRLQEQDVTTMKSVVDACPTMRFSVIITQVSDGVEYKSASTQVKDLLESLFPKQLLDAANSYHIIPEIDAARKKENVLLPIEQTRALQAFMNAAPLGKIAPKDVGHIKSSEAEMKKLQEEVKLAKEQASAMLKQFNDKMALLEDELKRGQQDREKQMQALKASNMQIAEREAAFRKLEADSARQRAEFEQRQRELESQKRQHQQGGFWESLGGSVGSLVNKFVSWFV
jgi:hypothetical protein